MQSVARMRFEVHEKALCESSNVGSGTRIGAFSHVRPGAVVGQSCVIGDQTFVSDDVVIGDHVRIGSGVHLSDGVRIESEVNVGANVVFSADTPPDAGKLLVTRVGRGATLGSNATLLPGVSVGQNARVGAGAVVMADVPMNAIVTGNPARISGYVGGELVAAEAARPTDDKVSATRVKGVTLHRMRMFQDLRGSLSAGEFERDVPFPAQRYFLVYDVPSEEVRGAHAHRRCEQFLVCIRGSCSVIVDDGHERQDIHLASPAVGVYLPPMTWSTQHRYSADAILLVFASHFYDAGDYIREYERFLSLIRRSDEPAARSPQESAEDPECLDA